MHEELIQQFKNGNKQAGDDFYRANIKLIYSATHKFKPMSIDVGETLALVNQAFAKAMMDFNPTKGKFSTYFMRKARGYISNYCRDLAYMIRTKRNDFAKTKKLVYCDSLDEIYCGNEFIGTSGLSKVGNEEDESQIIVDEAVKKIDERDRQIFILYFLKNYVQSEIAKIVDISPAQVSRSLTRSKASMKLILKEVS